MDELLQQRAETQQEALVAAEKDSGCEEIEDIGRKIEGKVAVIVMPGYTGTSAGRAETLLKQIAQAQREGMPVSSIYCPPSDSGEERAVSGKKAKKRGRPVSKPAEVGPDGQPIKRKRGRPRIHPKPEPTLAPDGSPIKRKRGRPRKNPLPDVEVGVEAPHAEDGVVKKRGGRPRKNPLPPKEQSEDEKQEQDERPQLPESSDEATTTTNQQLGTNGVMSALSSSSVAPGSLPVKKKRGRPRKNPQLVSPPPAVAAPPQQPQVPAVQATTPDVPVKRGRGRPRKHPVEGGAAPTPPTGVLGKRKRGRPRKNPLPDDAAPIKKRRGRPPKVQVAAAVSWGAPDSEKLSGGDAVAEIPKQQQQQQEEEEEVAAGSSKGKSSEKFLSITFSDASSDSEWSGAAKVSELATRVATGSMSEEPLVSAGGGGEGKPEESSDESSYISDV